MDNWFSTRVPRVFSVERTVFSMSDAGTTCEPTAREWSGPLLYTVFENYSNWRSKF